MGLDLAAMGPSELAPVLWPSAPRSGDHFVELYDEPAVLMASLRTFAGRGLWQGDSVIVVAEPAQRATLERMLVDSAIDLEAAMEHGRYTARDAQGSLDVFMVDGMPDGERFADLIAPLVSAAAASGKRVKVFGEMVALLWASGNVAAAIALEDLWNELAKVHHFDLFCAYPSSAFSPDDLPRLVEVCGRHSHVLPPSRRA